MAQAPTRCAASGSDNALLRETARSTVLLLSCCTLRAAQHQLKFDLIPHVCQEGAQHRSTPQELLVAGSSQAA